MQRRRQLRAFDLKQIAVCENLIGIDEAGRGAFAGPVVAAAVLVTREFLESAWARKHAGRINDSKQLTAAAREEIYAGMDKLALAGLLHASHGAATVDEIEQHNILGATKLAMRRALQEIYPASAIPRVRAAHEPELFPDAGMEGDEMLETVNSVGEAASPPAAARSQQISCRILVDGLPLKNFPYPHTAIVQGDARSLCIAMASIVAKVTRDRMMTALDAECPGYGFARHKGYGTGEHRDALLRLGASPQHRKVFLRKLLDARVDPAQIDFFVEDRPCA